MPLLKQLQQTPSNTLWIGIPSFVGNLPFEQVRPQVIEEILRQLYKTGLPKDANIFLGGHSLDGIGSQSLAVKHSNEIFGQILIGSSGGLDVLVRVTRIIESSRCIIR